MRSRGMVCGLCGTRRGFGLVRVQCGRLCWVLALVPLIGVGQAAAARPPGSAVLYSGLTGIGPNATKHVVSDAEALRVGGSNVTLWLRFVRGRSGGDVEERFRCVLPDGVLAMLHQESGRYGFSVKTVSCYEKDGSAPLVVVEGDHYIATARAITAVQSILDRLTRSESVFPFFVEAVDSRGVPYAEVFHFDHEDGGWVRADALEPAPPP